MRLRNKPWAKEKIKEYSNYVHPNPSELKGKWSSRFTNDHPIHIEVGCGKGQFIVEMAKKHPDINFVGVEQQTSVIITALEKQIEADLPNLQFLHEDGGQLTDFFKDDEVERIYLTFSDPWPKNRHEKRRLTYKAFLKVYEQILDKDKGKLVFKTDNRGLFEYSLVSFSQYGMSLEEVFLDLHQSNIEENVMTEYEEKFSKKGNVIYLVQASF